MNIAVIDPSSTNHSLQHRVRGVGYYFENLKKSLLRNDKNNSYSFCSKDNIPKNTDIIHYPYFEPFSPTLLFRKTKKTVVTVHDLTPFVFPKQFPSGIKGKIKWQIQKYSLRQVNSIITDSESSKKDIIKYAGVKEGKIRVIYLAAGEEFKKLEIGNWKLEIKRKYGLPDRFLLYVGDVTWNKNLPRLIEAVKKTNLTLVMVGKALNSTDFDKNNPWNQDLVKVQELCKGKKNIIRIGFVNDEDLVRLYNIATVFIMPSLYEGFGLPILEAMACGCPVITTKEGSLDEVSGDAVFYVDGYDTNSIAAGIKKVFNDENLRKELSKKGFENIKRFSWKKTVLETLEVYRQTIGCPKPEV